MYKRQAFRCAVAESLCAQLTTAALTVTVRELPWGEYAAALEGGDFDLYLGEVRLTADWDAGALLDEMCIRDRTVRSSSSTSSRAD